MKYFIILFIILFTNSIQAKDTTIVVHFEFNQYQISPKDSIRLITFIKTYSQSIIHAEISAHCDQIGSKAYNQKLSDWRAQELAKFIIRKGIPNQSVRMVAGYSNDSLVTIDTNASSRHQNRRGVLKFILRESISGLDKPNLKVGEKIKLDNLHFYGGRHTLLPSSENTLKKLLQLMIEHPQMEIDIQGHICCTPDTSDGYDSDNNTKNLSYNRAVEVKRYLVQNGIARNRVTCTGFGHQFPLTKEYTEEERALNRRVEIVITKE